MKFTQKQAGFVFVVLVISMLLATIYFVGSGIGWDFSYFSAELKADAPDIHGSCVFAVQEWHENPLLQYCIPAVGFDFRFSSDGVPSRTPTVVAKASSTPAPETTPNPTSTLQPTTTPVPTNTPAPTVTPNPTNTTAPVECKNPNAERDGSVPDCNAGKGQEKKK